MRSLTLYFLVFTFALINCQNLRNLILTRDPVKYQILVTAANKTVYQMYKKKIDFEDRNEVTIEDSSKMLLKVIVDDDPSIPEVEDKVIFNITKGKVSIPDLKYPDLKFEIFGKSYDLKEEFDAIAKMISAGYDDGCVYVYKKDSKVVAQTRFKCFVNSNDGEKYGSFEILVEDKNDYKDIVSKLEKWYNKVKEILTKVSPEIKVVSELVGTIYGTIKDLKGSSSFLKISSLYLLFILF